MDDPDPRGSPWKPTIKAANREHSRTTDRISAALVNRAMTPEPPPHEGRWPIYSHSLSGVVLSPQYNRLLCSYSFDSGTIMRTCGAKQGAACIPGCTKNGRNVWCEEGAGNHKWPCAWRPQDLKPMLELRERLRINQRKPEGKTWDDHKFYNELIFSADRYVGALPRSIEAVFYLKGGDCGDVFDGPKCLEYAVEAHASMRAHFGLTDEELPLLELDPYNWEDPFVHIPPPSPPPSPSPPKGLKGQASPRPPCRSPWCATFGRWYDDTGSKFWSLWGDAYKLRRGRTGGCWEKHGGASFFSDVLAGTTCDRNWLEGAVGRRGQRPYVSNGGGQQEDAPALLGFDESIVEMCSSLLHLEPWADGQDLNQKLAERCLRARRNVLRLLTGGWTMCQNLEWQMCALQGMLPGQGSARVSFATAPRDLQLQWWDHPSTHPTFPCDSNGWCDPKKYFLGDVYFAEVFVAFTVCSNGADLFALAAGDFFECALDKRAYHALAKRFQES